MGRAGRTTLRRSSANELAILSDAELQRAMKSVTSAAIPAAILDTLDRTDPSWYAVLNRALRKVAECDPTYLPALAATTYLPTDGRLLAAFAQPRDAVRFVLIGEGPYPRAASATGVCFMDGAVGALWSENGLSKAVNRATSLRNFIKMLLVADGTLLATQTTGSAMAEVGAAALMQNSARIQTLAQLQQNLTAQGFLLLNASLVFRPDVVPLKDARAWMPFLTVILVALAMGSASASVPTLVLWGKIASQVNALPGATCFPQITAEHPYNLSFIQNRRMHALFRPMTLLSASAAAH